MGVHSSEKRAVVPPFRRYVEIIKDTAFRYDFPDAYIRMLEEVAVVDG